MKSVNFFSKVGRNVHLTCETKAKLIGIVIGIIIALVAVSIHMISCYKWCTSNKHQLRYNIYCTDYEDNSLPKNCIVDQFYMNK